MSKLHKKLSFQCQPNGQIQALQLTSPFPGKNQSPFPSIYDQAFQIMKECSLYSMSCQSPDYFDKSGQINFCDKANIFYQKLVTNQFSSFKETETQQRPRKCSQFNERINQKLGDVNQRQSIRKSSYSIPFQKSIMEIQTQNQNKLQNCIQDDKLFVNLSKSKIQFLGYFNDQIRIVSFKCYKQKRGVDLVHCFKLMMTETDYLILQALMQKQQRGQHIQNMLFDNCECQYQQHPYISFVTLQVFSLK